MTGACMTNGRGCLLERASFAPADSVTPLIVVLAGLMSPRSLTAFAGTRQAG